jgi:lipoprotein-anchoring transpeptidase ErfK/SrfK
VSPAVPATLRPAQIAALPAADYAAVIPALLQAPGLAAASDVFRIAADTALYGSDRVNAVARLEAHNFLGNASVVVPIETDGAWSLILTPSRRILPSRVPAGEIASAQTAAWIPTSTLIHVGTLPNRVVVSISAQTLTITDAAGAVQQTFTVGVGSPNTPTPTGVTGYLQARYLDPAQGQAAHPIQLTSLHATGADEPYGGSDGGLIGIHYQAVSSGAVSHGCIRLDEAAIDAVNRLPLGTPVTIVA